MLIRIRDEKNGRTRVAPNKYAVLSFDVEKMRKGEVLRKSIKKAGIYFFPFQLRIFSISQLGSFLTIKENKSWDPTFNLRYISILPRVAQASGFELGSGMYINNLLPEVASEFLINIKTTEGGKDAV